jgi:hypothetical protein
MNLKEIRTECWDIAREVGDSDDNRYWTSKEMNRYINRVYRFIARETRCIRDAHTAAVCRISVTPPADLITLQAQALTDVWAADDLAGYNTVGSWLYNKLIAPRVFPLHKSILDIDECKWLGVPWKLTKKSVTAWNSNPRWEQVVGYPTEYATDYQNDSICLNWRSTVADTLLLTVRRMPLADLVADADIPEIRVHYHDFMVNGVLSQMYQKQDIETFSLAKADDYGQKFARDVDEIKQQETILDQRLKANYSMSAFR